MTIVQEIRRKWRPRPRESHKGDFGKIFILAGSEGLTGAAHLCAAGALRAGAGLVTVGVPRKIYPVLARREAEVMVRPFASGPEGALAFRALKPVLDFLNTQEVLAVGPGLSQHSETQRLIRELVRRTKHPLVLDADGLNAFQGHTGLLKYCKKRAVLTPHPGEFIRLFGGKLSAEDQGRGTRACQLAERFGVFMVLKGHHTIVASPEGEIYLNRTGNPGMATGGTGDILTGILAALLGQNFSFWDAARFGVYLHGLAGDLAKRKTGEVSLTASDILNCLPEAIQRMVRH